MLVLADVDDALVRDTSLIPAIEHRKVGVEPGGDVVRIQDGEAAGLRQAVCPHHRDVGVADGKDRSGTPWRCTHHPRISVTRRSEVRQMWREVLGDADWTDARTTAAVRDTEGLVEVQVTNVGAVVARSAESDLCVEVRPIEVHLAPVTMHDRARLFDRRLEDPVGRGIGDHERAEHVFMFGRQTSEIFDIDTAVFVRGDRNNRHARHHCGGRVGAVRRLRDQAHRAFGVAIGSVPRPDCQQAGVLALGAGVGLHRRRREARDLGKPSLKSLDELGVPDHLIGWRVRMDATELWPRHRNHLGRRIELHRATSERNHRVRQRQVLVSQRRDVAQHLRLGTVAVEYGVGQVWGRSHPAIRDHGGFRRSLAADKTNQHRELRLGDGLVERDTHGTIGEAAKIEACRQGAVGERFQIGARVEHNRVKEGVCHPREARGIGGQCEPSGHAVYPLANGPQAIGTVVHAIHRRNHREENLSGADVGRCGVATDVLFARLQRHAQCWRSGRVDRDRDEAPGQAPSMSLGGREERCVRSTGTEWYAESLG